MRWWIFDLLDFLCNLVFSTSSCKINVSNNWNHWNGYSCMRKHSQSEAQFWQEQNKITYNVKCNSLRFKFWIKGPFSFLGKRKSFTNIWHSTSLSALWDLPTTAMCNGYPIRDANSELCLDLEFILAYQIEMKMKMKGDNRESRWDKLVWVCLNLKWMWNWEFWLVKVLEASVTASIVR